MEDVGIRVTGTRRSHSVAFPDYYNPGTEAIVPFRSSLSGQVVG